MRLGYKIRTSRSCKGRRRKGLLMVPMGETFLGLGITLERDSKGVFFINRDQLHHRSYGPTGGLNQCIGQ